MNLDIVSNLFTSPLTAAPAWLIIFLALYFGANKIIKMREDAAGDRKFIIDNIEMIIMPYVHDAIIVAYKMSEKSVDDLQERMSGIDKLTFATIVYDMLPESIMGVSRELIYELVPRERFAQLVSYAVEHVNKFIDDKQVVFDEAYQNWMEETPPFSKK